MTRESLLRQVLVPEWPKLAWVLSLDRHGQATVLHGPAVETRRDWVFEGVWDGDFEKGDFDRSDLVFGSGVRVRGDDIVCVGSSTTLDRLWSFEFGGRRWVSNTLPGALAASGASLDMEYARYRGDLESIVFGLRDYRRFVPFSGGDLEVVYFDNLRLVVGDTARMEKPEAVPAWPDFEGYRQYLRSAAHRIGENARAVGRTTHYDIVATLSTGYDSTASAVIAREAGATRVWTIRRARSLIPRADSGEAIARALGLDCREYDPPGAGTADEEWFLAAIGSSMDLNLAAFDYPGERLTLLFTGFHGDKFWDLHEGKPNREIVRGDPSGLGFTEYRLLRGVTNCAVPFWGVRHAAAMKSISRSPRMAKWTLGTGYDRPIPRRIAEDAGVPRSSFGQRKSATSIDDAVYWPMTTSVERMFAAFLRSRHRRRPPVRLARLANHLELSGLRHFRELTKLGWPRIWVRLPEGELLIPWAVAELTSRLRTQLDARLLGAGLAKAAP